MIEGCNGNKWYAKNEVGPMKLQCVSNRAPHGHGTSIYIHFLHDELFYTLYRSFLFLVS